MKSYKVDRYVGAKAHMAYCVDADGEEFRIVVPAQWSLASRPEIDVIDYEGEKFSPQVGSHAYIAAKRGLFYWALFF